MSNSPNPRTESYRENAFNPPDFSIPRSGLIAKVCISKFSFYLCGPEFQNSIMKKDIHPTSYRMVVFKDMSADYSFITRSCVDTKETVTWEDGNEYPLYKLEISSKSHPFYTGKQQLVDTAGRIDKFMKRYGKK
jgi:large subunit ribosomal protein L31